MCPRELGSRLSGRRSGQRGEWRHSSGWPIRRRLGAADDRRRFDFVIHGAGARGEAMCCDATLVSPVRRDGSPQAGAPERDGVALAVAQRRKLARYPELTRGGPHRLCVLAAEIGGRWNDESQRLVQRLIALRARRAPAGGAWSRGGLKNGSRHHLAPAPGGGESPTCALWVIFAGGGFVFVCFFPHLVTPVTRSLCRFDQVFVGVGQGMLGRRRVAARAGWSPRHGRPPKHVGRNACTLQWWWS